LTTCTASVNPLAGAARREKSPARMDGGLMNVEQGETAGMRGMFWSWTGIIVIGLIAMIGIPLAGR